MLNTWLAILGALLGAGGFIVYLISTISGRIRPNVVTWSLWSLPPLIGFVYEIKSGAGPEAMMTLALTVGPIVVVVASIASRSARPSAVTRLDRLCAVLALATIASWVLIRNGDAALTLAITADGLAAVPTVLKTYREPDSECRKALALFCASGAVTLLAINEWNPASFAYPIYIFAVSGAILALSAIPHRGGGYGLAQAAP